MALALRSKDPFDRAMALLPPKEQRFVREYLRERNGGKAARRAGYSVKSAYTIAWRLLKKVEIQAAIREQEKRELAEDQDYLRRLKWQNKAIAEFDHNDVVDEHGDYLPLHEWPPEARAALAGVEVVMKNATAGDGKIDRVLKLKFWNKNDALRLDYERLGQTEPSGEQGPDVPAFIFLTGDKVAIE